MSKPEDGVAVFLGRDGKAVGMGVVVSRRHVLTCAHVVNVALGAPDDCQETPDNPVPVVFPYSRTDRQSRPIHGTVPARGWHPVHSAGGPHPEVHDVAVVQLGDDAPDDAGVASLAGTAPVLDHGFVAKRINNPKGDTAVGTIGTMSPDGTFELRGADFIGTYVQEGFSGAGCWGKEILCVMGVVVTARKDAERIAHMIPAAALRRALENASADVPPAGGDDKGFRRLRELAVGSLKNGREAVEILAQQLRGSPKFSLESLDHQVRCEQVVTALLRVDAAVAVKAMVLGYLAAADGTHGGPGPDAARAIEKLCYHVLPIIYQPLELRRVRACVLTGGTLVSLPATFKTSVEMIMAGVDGRQVRLRSPSSPKDFPPGEFLLQDPPEAGLDHEGGQFVADFQRHLTEKLLPLGCPSQTPEASIAALLEQALEIDGYRYYYIYSQTEDQAVRRRRQDIVTGLQVRFPSIVFFGLERPPEPVSELKILDLLNRLLCKVAKVEWKR